MSEIPNELLDLAERVTSPEAEEMPVNELQVTLRFDKATNFVPIYDQQFARLGPQRLVMKHLYWDGGESCFADVILTIKAFNLLETNQPAHVSLTKDVQSKWKDTGKWAHDASKTTDWVKAGKK